MIPKKIRDKVWERSRGICEAKLEGCWRSGTDIHHIKYRSRMGTNGLENLIVLCTFCHRAIHDHKEGTEKYRAHSWTKKGLDEGGNEIVLGEVKG